MKKVSADAVRIETASALEAVLAAGNANRYGAYVGLVTANRIPGYMPIIHSGSVTAFPAPPSSMAASR
jgi:hypothetical protein